MTPTVLWLRRDLRLLDHPALGAAHAAGDGGPVLPLFVLDPALWAGSSPATRSRLAASLRSLQARYDGRLVVRTGAPELVVAQVAAEVGTTSVHISAETTPYGRRRDLRVRQALAAEGRSLVATGTPYAVGPGTLLTGGGTPFQVFTPFRRAWLAHGWPQPAPVPPGLRWARGVESEPLPRVAEDAPGRAHEAPGELVALDRWAAFAQDGLDRYSERRNRPDLDGTSRLSEALKYGEVHPRTLLAGLAELQMRGSAGATDFMSELCWREFYADVLWHEPHSAWSDLKPALAWMTYDEPGEAAEAWSAGRTGYPIVDAGMRQLLTEGWMHNRVRMLTASFLVKDLHVWWPYGARVFLRHLRDVTSPRTPTAGSGPPARAPTLRHTSGSSTRSARGCVSTRTATTSAATSPSCATSPVRARTSRGRRRAGPRRATRSASSTTPASGARPCSGMPRPASQPGRPTPGSTALLGSPPGRRDGS